MTELVPRLRADDALRMYGFDGERLMRLARAVANEYCGRHRAALGDRLEDLISVLHEAGCKAAIAYEPTRSGPGYSFASYLWDKMELAIEPDFFRRKREGFGDRRYGNDNRIVLVGTGNRTGNGRPDTVELHDFDVDPELDFEKLLSERRLMRWKRAAELYDLSLEEFVAVAVDRVARETLSRAAA